MQRFARCFSKPRVGKSGKKATSVVTDKLLQNFFTCFVLFSVLSFF